MKLFTSLTLASLFITGAASLTCATSHAQDSKSAEKRQPVQAQSMTDAEVRKVDKETQSITLKHGEIKNLGMPGMTMVFQVKDAAVLDNIKAGDKVRFSAENIDGSIV